MIPIKSVSSLEALTLTSSEKNGLEFFSKKISKILNIFLLKIEVFWGVKPGPLESPIIHLMAHKKTGGLLFEKIEYSMKLAKN